MLVMSISPQQASFHKAALVLRLDRGLWRQPLGLEDQCLPAHLCPGNETVFEPLVRASENLDGILDVAQLLGCLRIVLSVVGVVEDRFDVGLDRRNGLFALLRQCHPQCIGPAEVGLAQPVTA
jgi:hypothetical protein